MKRRTSFEPDAPPRRLTFTAEIDRVPHGCGLWQRSEPRSPAREALFEMLREAIETALTEKQRRAVRLFFFEGLSQGEIAQREGVTQQVIQRRLYGARRGDRVVGGALPRLRRALDPGHLCALFTSHPPMKP